MALIDVKEVMNITGLKEAKCYEIMRTLNAEQKEAGIYVIRGKTNEKYLYERLGLLEDYEKKERLAEQEYQNEKYKQ
ncbi:MAG: hypothetical protein WBH77_07030 [Saccharofermentanales bacterium]